MTAGTVQTLAVWPVPEKPCAGNPVSPLLQLDAVNLDEIRKTGLYDKIWRAVAVVLLIRPFGVPDDGRTHD